MFGDIVCLHIYVTAFTFHITTFSFTSHIAGDMKRSRGERKRKCNTFFIPSKKKKENISNVVEKHIKFMVPMTMRVQECTWYMWKGKERERKNSSSLL